MRKAGDIITALFSERFGPDFMESARTSAGLFSSWARVVEEAWPGPVDGVEGKSEPPAAAVHSRIRELEQGLLLVEADHPGWIQILQTKQAELLSAVRRRYPALDIKGIAFRLSREPFVPRDSVPVREQPSVLGPPESPPRPRTEARDAQADEEFHVMLARLEESIKQRNNL